MSSAAAAAWDRPPGRSGRWLLAAALLVVLLAVVAAYALWHAGVIGPDTGVQAEDLERVVLVAAAPDEDGAVVAQIVVLVDVSEPQTQVAFVSPATGVSIPGTAYETLADAYPFGGGAGVADAYARAAGGEAPAHLTVGPGALARAVDAAGGVRLTLPADMAVFDGETLFALSEGPGRFSGAELEAVFKGAPYLTDAERAQLDAELGHAFVGLLAEWPEGGLMAALERADISTSMSRAASERVLESLAQVR